MSCSRIGGVRDPSNAYDLDVREMAAIRDGVRVRRSLCSILRRDLCCKEAF